MKFLMVKEHAEPVEVDDRADSKKIAELMRKGYKDEPCPAPEQHHEEEPEHN